MKQFNGDLYSGLITVPIPAEVFWKMRGGPLMMLTSSFRKGFLFVKLLWEVQRPLVNLDKAGGLLVCPGGYQCKA